MAVVVEQHDLARPPLPLVMGDAQMQSALGVDEDLLGPIREDVVPRPGRKRDSFTPHSSPENQRVRP